jgi:hypothetical protein
MATAEVGSLRVTLGMDIAEFIEGSQRAATMTSVLVAKFGLIASVAVAAGTAIAGKLGSSIDSYVTSIKDAINETDDIANAAKKFGLSISEVTGLIRDNGLYVSTFKTGMEALGESIFKVASGDATSEAARAFDAIGVSALNANGKMRPVGDVLKDIAGKFATYKDGIERNTLATDLFGKAGKDMANVLDLGAKAFKEDADGALDLSHVLSDLYNNAAKKLGDAWDELSNSFSNFFDALTGGQVTSKGFAATVRDWGKAALDSLPSTRQIKEAIDGLFEVALKTEQRFQRLAANISGMGRAVMALFTSDDVKTVNDETEAAIKKIDASAAASLATFRALSAGWGATAEDVKKASTSIAITDAPMKQTLKEIAEAQREWNRSVTEGVNLAKQSEAPWTKYNRQITDLGNAFKAGKIDVEQYALAQKNAIEQANIAFAGGAELIAKNTSPYQQMQVEIQKLTDKFNAGAISAEAFGQAQQQAALVAVQGYASGAANIASSLTQVFSKSKGVAIASAIINSFQAASNALAQVPYPLNFAAAAAALAAGFVQVQNIRKTTEGGGGGGGSAASAPAATAPTQAPQQLRVEGINPNSLFTGSAVKSLADALLNFQRDGGQVVLA